MLIIINQQDTSGLFIFKFYCIFPVEFPTNVSCNIEMQSIFLMGSIDVQFIDAMRTLIESVYSYAFQSQFNGSHISKALFDINLRIDQSPNKTFTISDHEVDQTKCFGSDSIYDQKYVQLILTSRLETNSICNLFHGFVTVLYESIKW